MKSKILFTSALLLNYACCLGNTVECTDKQECFPKESATWYLFENEKIDKKLATELKSVENGFAKQIKSPELGKLLQVQFKKSLELSHLECGMIYYLSKSGAHWPGVHVAECKIAYKKNHLVSLREAQSCIRNGIDENVCIPLLFKVNAWGGLEN